jgi:hypothetical protein
MSTDSVLQLPDPPDLLRRFVETPLEQSVILEGKRVLVRTNHPGCYELLSRHAGSSEADTCDLTWTIVSDTEMSSDLGEATLMESGSVAVLSFGRGCFMALQRDRMELIGFISNSVDEHKLEEIILPRIRELIATPHSDRISHA